MSTSSLAGAALHKACIAAIALFLVLCGATAGASAESAFSFESVTTIDDMSSVIKSRFPLGTSRADLRRAFVEEGRATLKVRADDPDIEKYIYDIDLCHYYVWRWNISADFDAGGRLRQAYVNGNIVFPDGNPKRIVSRAAEQGKKAAIYSAQRPRPEAYKGERRLGYLLYDRDGDLATTGDQALVGAGPSRADPMNMGTIVVYADVDPWRSIYDFDAADRIVPYQGDCKEVDRQMDAQKR